MSWHVLHLKPRSEKKTAKYCGLLGMDCYLPLRRESRIYQRRKVVVDKPLFPGYLFVSLTRPGRLALLKTNNVLRELSAPDDSRLLYELDQIRKALSVDPALGACKALEKGKRVRVRGGPFMGVEGIVSFKGKTRVRLNVEMIGQAVAVEVEEEWLEVID
ncbi:MAG: transcription termination/antitermination NusG family protein [Kiritimatiellia bacterium]